MAAACADDTNEDDDEEEEDEDEQGTNCSEPKSRDVLAAVGASARTYAGASDDDAGTKAGVGAGTSAGT